LWRPVLSEPRLASYEEIERFWSVDDLFDAHEILDVIQAIKEIENKEVTKKGK